ncbi:hypothetical protein [uncultured Nonlabens sp.]|uniref:hypothetical protein n=1 Tax=uncultured Nonlabens sp. TaxID=859306 RepID=UPI0026360916|nr:hypothetical protein [uncultured Nonlabens sp.]
MPTESKIKKTPTGLFLFFTSFISTAQISGIAVNEKKEPVAFATVILKTVQDSSIVAFTQTDKPVFYITVKRAALQTFTFNLTNDNKITQKKLGFFLVS